MYPVITGEWGFLQLQAQSAGTSGMLAGFGRPSVKKLSGEIYNISVHYYLFILFIRLPDTKKTLGSVQD